MIAYRNRASAIHRMSPYPKLVWVIGIVAMSLLFDNPLYLGLLFLATLPVVAAGKVWKEWASYLRVALFLSAVVLVVNILVNYNGSHILAEAPFRLPGLGRPQITLEAIVAGIGNCLRLLSTISAFSVLTLTVHPDDLMQVMLGLRLPSRSVLVTSLSTRFVPVLAGDIQRITEVQQSRGLDLGKGGLRQRIKSRAAVIIPLLANSLDRSVQVAEAMEARGFGSGKDRTNFRRIALQPADIAAVCLLAIALGLGILMHVLGQGAFRYFPSAGMDSLNLLSILMLVGLIILLVSIVPLAFAKRSGP